LSAVHHRNFIDDVTDVIPETISNDHNQSGHTIAYMSKKTKILVTSALPYANGAIHFGHLAGAYLPADIYVRYHRLKGSDIVYICGSDEHGVSILISATKENVSPQDIIDRYHFLNKEAFERVGISFDNYSRTSLPVHHETAQEWFTDLERKDILVTKMEEQLFDPKAGMFLPDRFVIGTCPHCGNERAYGDQCENCSKYYKQTELLNPKSLLSDAQPVVRDATHWYFPLGRFQEQLTRYVESHAGDWKDNVLQQVRSWLTAGLSDRPITRDLDWGVAVPREDAKGKVLYVWFEAVLGYISSTKEWAAQQGDPEKWKEFWCDPETKYVAFIGKDNIVFHCLMFPAMLMAKGDYVLPDNVPANEFLNLEGKKFSKSLGWSIELKDFLDNYPADPLRYTLAMNMPETRDSDFYWKDFQARNNNELADILGNFVNRTVHFIWKNFEGKVPEAIERNKEDEAFLAEFRNTADTAADCYERYRFRDGITATMNLARLSNKYFNDQMPWKTLKTDPQRCAATLNACVQAIHALTVLFDPILPFTTAQMRDLLNPPESPWTENESYKAREDGMRERDPIDPWAWESASSFTVPSGHQLGEARILFQKIDDEKIAGEIAKLGALPGASESGPVYEPLKAQIEYDDFTKMDFRIGHVLSAERIPKSEKLIRLQVDLGFEKRQLVAGIGKSYEADALVGKKIVVLANLKPAKLFGVESQGMLLAATEPEGAPVVLIPESDVLPGSIVK
jgi:methionyl-tRNA synthetase